MADAELVGRMRRELGLLAPQLDERSWRLVLGAVARAAGAGGTDAVAHAARVSWQTVADGAAELESGQGPGPGRVRRPGGGRRRLAETDPGLLPALLALVEDSTRGDPVSPLTWTTKSLASLARELTAAGHPCSPQTAGRLLRGEGFSLQANAKVAEGRQHPDRDAQFRYIAGQAQEFLAAGDPVISVDAKKKEQAGPYAQGGREWRPKGSPAQVRDHDFPQDDDPAKVTPYGVYDIGANTGFVNVGTDHDTAAFAVESVRCWWDTLGRDRYPGARRLLITADAGGSNGYRTRAWKTGLAQLSRQTGLQITCCHFPPGTSKWNKIEHRLFSQITRNWRARPLTSHEVIVATIAATTTATGLTVTARLDTSDYPEGATIPPAQLRELEDTGALTRHPFHPAWNYTLHPDPAPPPPPAPAPLPRHDALIPVLHALASPQLTGMTRHDLDTLASATQIPAAAARDYRLHLARGRPRRRPPGPPALPHPAQVLATILRDRHHLPYHALAYLLGVSTDTITPAITTTREILAQHGTTITPAPPKLTTLTSLRNHATAAGITIPDPPPRRAHST